MKLSLSTQLDAPADTIWETLQKTESLRYVTRPLLGFKTDLPKYWRDAVAFRIKHLTLLNVIPLRGYEIQIITFDDQKREALTNERGGPATTWRHRIRVKPISETRSRYTDEVEIHAGRLTPLVWAFAHLFYRQARWRALARLLG